MTGTMIFLKQCSFKLITSILHMVLCIYQRSKWQIRRFHAAASPDADICSIGKACNIFVGVP